MPKDVRYAVKRGLKYLVDIHPNETYNPYSVAPTMGNRHMPCEACTEWGDEPVYFEPYTLCSNLKVLAEEYPEYASIDIGLPDEKSRRVGQSIAAASLPANL